MTSATHTRALFSGPTAKLDQPADLLLEVPHGATTPEHLLAADKLGAKKPTDWDTIYWCSTDQGAPEVAHTAASLLTDPAWVQINVGEDAAHISSALNVLVIRGTIPRHLADLNRAWNPDGLEPGAPITSPTPPWLRDQPEVMEKLRHLHSVYSEEVARAYETICGVGGFAMQVHTYSPRSVSLPNGLSGAALRRAWSDELREQWPTRPPGQLISSRAEGPALVPRALLEVFVEEFSRVDLALAIDDPFTMHPATMIDAWAHEFEGQMLGLEIGRAQLSESYDPLARWAPDPELVERFAGALARSILRGVLG